MEDMAWFYDAHRCEAPQYNISDKVWLSSENIKMTWPMKKLDYKWLGPLSCQLHHLSECLPPQTALILWPSPPHILFHPPMTLQARPHCRTSTVPPPASATDCPQWC